MFSMMSVFVLGDKRVVVDEGFNCFDKFDDDTYFISEIYFDESVLNEI